ncbi:MAG: hypothetical protein J0I43_10730 [Microbacterium sp.]|uniref:DUF6412 domain-containing protein n=1 Tax=Microbacterium sp. TaxID=51671 RepID=UPI001AD2A1B3|nr:DUF6412 domain-containing protein [Microbacterium sp.]MBN9177830.1 hypothetical protein [Microbacterium sp.]
MIDIIAGVLRAVLATAGLLALADPAASSSIAVVAAVALALTMLVVAIVGAAARANPRGATSHPTRRSELRAPLAQSDPDAAGHVRRRGPGQVLAAA